MTRTRTLAHALDNSGLIPETGLARPGTVTVDVGRRYHHPRFLGSQPCDSPGVTMYSFSPFTGFETQPHVPREVHGDPALTRQQRQDIYDQYESATVLWSWARLRRSAGPLLRQAVPQWQKWTTARDALRETFQEFWHIEDGRWRAQLLRLTDAQLAATAAARAWAELARQLGRLAEDQIRATGDDHELPLTTIAEELGLTGSADWYIPYFRQDVPMVADLQREIESQRQRVLEVAHLAGDHDDAPTGR